MACAGAGAGGFPCAFWVAPPKAAAARAVPRASPLALRPGQVLTLRVPEGEVQREQVLIAIVNNANSRLMIKVGWHGRLSDPPFAQAQVQQSHRPAEQLQSTHRGEEMGARSCRKVSGTLRPGLTQSSRNGHGHVPHSRARPRATAANTVLPDRNPQASLPLGALVPYKHWNLRLVMPGGPLGSAVHLYVTAVLTDCPRLQQRHLRNHMADARQLLQARLASASAPLCSLGESTWPSQHRAGNIVTYRHRLTTSAAQRHNHPTLQRPCSTTRPRK